MIGLNSPQLTITPFTCVFKEIRISYSYSGTRDELKTCLDLLAKGVVKPQITTGRLEEVQSALDDLNAGKIVGRKVLLPWKR